MSKGMDLCADRPRQVVVVATVAANNDIRVDSVRPLLAHKLEERSLGTTDSKLPHDMRDSHDASMGW